MTNAERDQQILALVLQGTSRTQIALGLALSPSAVERTLGRLRRRHYVTRTEHLIVKVLREQIDAERAARLAAERERDQCRRQLAVLDRRGR